MLHLCHARRTWLGFFDEEQSKYTKNNSVSLSQQYILITWTTSGLCVLCITMKKCWRRRRTRRGRLWNIQRVRTQHKHVRVWEIAAVFSSVDTDRVQPVFVKVAPTVGILIFLLATQTILSASTQAPREHHSSRSKLAEMNKQKRVQVAVLPTLEIPTKDDMNKLSRAERKKLWYSREELMSSCLEAKHIVKIINSVNGNFGAIDHSQVCVVGLEKFHGKKEREKYKKLLIKSVLIRQEMNRGLGKADENCLREISQMISGSFKEFALWQAAMHKFHAHDDSSSTNTVKRDIPVDESPRKRQKRDSLSNGIISIPSNVHSDPTQVRQEVHQLMAGFCS